MMKKSILATICCLISLNLWGQQGVTVNEDPQITQMFSAYVAANKVEKFYDGFRLQIAATTDRRKMEEVIGEFRSRYAGVPIEWVQQRPYYKVKVGAFLSRNDAQNFLKNLKKDFPDAYLVQDRIKASELNNGNGN
jgi:hypothetical protein